MTQNQTEEKSDPSLSTISLDEDLMQIGEPKSRLTPLGDTSKGEISRETFERQLKAGDGSPKDDDGMLPPKPPPPPPPPNSRPSSWQIALLTIGVAVIVWYVAR